jgi:hypothetical protein
MTATEMSTCRGNTQEKLRYSCCLVSGLVTRQINLRGAEGSPWSIRPNLLVTSTWRGLWIGFGRNTIPLRGRREVDGADREQEGARGEAEAEDMVAALGGGSEGAKQLDRSQHQEEQGKDHSPGDGALGGEYSSGLRGGRDRQEAGGDDGREALHGSVTAKRDRMGCPQLARYQATYLYAAEY